MKYIYKIVWLGLLLTSGLWSAAQIGGNATPLQYSVHTYSIQMASISNTADWGVYPAGTTQAAIENSTATKLVDGVVYTKINRTWPASDISHFCIQFSTLSGPTALGNYVIGYKESVSNGSNLCVTARILPIQVYGPFDIDVAVAAADAVVCSDSSGVLKRPGDHRFHTTVQYQVTMNFPSTYVEENQWTFDFQVVAVGVSGASAAIDQITITGTNFTTQSYTPASGTSDYTHSCTVNPSSVSSLTFTIMYSDVLGVRQNIQLKLSAIVGPYEEQDIDVISGGAGNTTANVINAMPNAGDIIAWN